MRRFITTALAAALAISSLQAQSPMSLKQCMEYALDNSTKVLNQQLSVDDSRIARRDAILGAFLPSISAGSGASSSFGRSIDPETNTYISTANFSNSYSLSAGITLFNGFSAVNNVRISKLALEMGVAREQLAKDEVCLAVMQAFCNVLYYQELSEMLEGQLKTSQEALRLVSRQEQLGQKGYADVVEMEAEAASRELQLVNARNSLESHTLTLKDLMLYPLDEPLLLDDSLASSEHIGSLDSAADRETAVQNALRLNPSLRIASLTLSSASYNYQTAKWRFAPRLSMSAGMSTGYNTYLTNSNYTADPFGAQLKNKLGQYVSLSLSIPIFDGLSNHSYLHRQKNAMRRAENDYRQQRRELESEVRRAIQDRDGASAAFYSADRSAARQEEAYRLNQRKFEQGLISPIDLQRATDNWLRAETDRLNSLLQYHIKRSVVNYYNGISYTSQEY